MLGTIINNTLQLQEPVMCIDGRMVSNPTDSQLRTHGYKDVVFSEMPTDGNYNQKLRQGDTQIFVEWEAVEIVTSNI